mgnify:CR=1 FL=1
MYLGIDLGTSAVKTVLVDDAQHIVAESSAPLEVSRPHANWSEQDPEDWWRASEAALAQLGVEPDRVGLSGQMHGLVCLDELA